MSTVLAIDVQDAWCASARLLGVPLPGWSMRAALAGAPGSPVVIVGSSAVAGDLATCFGIERVESIPDGALLLDPRQPFVDPNTVRRALDGARRDVVTLQRSPIESCRANDNDGLELCEALARGLAPDHVCVAGVRRLRLPWPCSIDAVISDIDGTLTAGEVIPELGQEAGRFFGTRDGLGHALLTRAGIEIAWLSATSSGGSIIARAQMLGLAEDRIDVGAGDKGPRVRALLGHLGVEPTRALFIGDDVNDLPAMEVCALSACPADAHPAVRARVDLVLEAPGGRGAFRELADALLDAQHLRSTGS